MSTNPMVQMSRAIRHVLEDNSSETPVTRPGRLQDIKTETLADFVEIIAAFYADLRDELGRREVKP